MVKRSNKGWSKALEKKLSSKLPDVAERAMLRVESEAKRVVYLGHPQGHLNRQTGTLGRSITTEVETFPGGTIVVSTGTNVVYAATHEFGDERVINGKTVHIPARPYLIPSFRAKKEEVKEIVCRGIKDILKEVEL